MEGTSTSGKPGTHRTRIQVGTVIGLGGIAVALLVYFLEKAERDREADKVKLLAELSACRKDDDTARTLQSSLTANKRSVGSAMQDVQRLTTNYSALLAEARSISVDWEEAIRLSIEARKLADDMGNAASIGQKREQIKGRPLTRDEWEETLRDASINPAERLGDIYYVFYRTTLGADLPKSYIESPERALAFHADLTSKVGEFERQQRKTFETRSYKVFGQTLQSQREVAGATEDLSRRLSDQLRIAEEALVRAKERLKDIERQAAAIQPDPLCTPRARQRVSIENVDRYLERSLRPQHTESEE